MTKHNRNGDGPYCASTPASTGPAPRPAMLIAAASSPARSRPDSGATSTMLAVAVPVKIPADNPDSRRPASSQATSLPIRKAPADRADSTSPPMSSGLRPS